MIISMLIASYWLVVIRNVSSSWLPSTTKLQIQSLKYMMDYKSENPLDVWEPLGVDKHNSRRSMADNVTNVDDSVEDSFNC